MSREKPSYSIQATTYVKRPTGKIDQYGHPVYETVGAPKKRILRNEKNFADLKKSVFDKSSKSKNVFVSYSKPSYRIQQMPRRLNNVTKRNADGSKEVTYYNAVKGK